MSPFVHLFVDLQRLETLGPLRDDDLRATIVHVFDDPIAVEGLIREHRTELGTLDQRCDANRVVAVGGHQNEPHEVAQGVDKGKNLGGPSALGLAYGLALSPPLAPIPWR